MPTSGKTSLLLQLARTRSSLQCQLPWEAVDPDPDDTRGRLCILDRHHGRAETLAVTFALRVSPIGAKLD